MEGLNLGSCIDLANGAATELSLEAHRATSGTHVFASADLHSEGICKKQTGLSLAKSPPAVVQREKGGEVDGQSWK